MVSNPMSKNGSIFIALDLSPQDSAPNVLLIMTDDQGFADLRVRPQFF
jgi:hypothetical protein